MSCFIIAEAGVNHNGSVERALEMIDVAARAGANAVKFQTFRAEHLATEFAPKAAYQLKQTGQGSQFAMLRALELKESDYPALIDRCQALGIEFMSTPFDVHSAQFLVQLGMARIKVPSGELTNQPFLVALAQYGLPLLVSTGMADMAEVQEAVGWIHQARAQAKLEPPKGHELILLHCTSNYPTTAQDVNLRAMRTIAQTVGLPIGYSDHTKGVHIAAAAVALGAIVIEKHFTLDRNLPGPDHQASLEPDELADLVCVVRDIEAALGDGIKTPRPSELPVRDVARRSVTLRTARACGDALRTEDLDILRPGTGIAPKALNQVVGRHLKHDLPSGSTLNWDDLA